MLLAGAGRSGTSWVARLISSQIPCRVMFEPFNPVRVSAFRGFPDFCYRRPEDEDPDLEAYARRILTGRIRDRWIDPVAFPFPR